MMKRLMSITIVLMLAACGGGNESPEPEPEVPDNQPRIEAARVETAGPELAPGASAFESAEPLSVTMLPQTITLPYSTKSAPGEITARAVHDGKWLSLQLTWADPHADTSAGISDFQDMVAVQFPGIAGSTPNIMMGAPGNPVVIFQWRAARQTAIDRGERPEMRHSYPNATKDIDIADLVGEDGGGPYTGSAYVDNPLALPDLDRSPVLAQVAAGFGSLTAVTDRLVEGRGKHANGRWVVVMHIPLGGDDPLVPGLAPGESSLIAFAAWDGGSDEAGSRKLWSPAWTAIKLK